VSDRPQYGDKRNPLPCDFCGEPLYEVYDSWPVYHNDTQSGWVRESHRGYSGGHFGCIKALAERVKRLEEQAKKG